MFFSKGAPPHKTAAGFIVSIGDHAVSRLADRGTVFVDLNGIRDGLGTPTVTVEVNESPYPPVFEQIIGRIYPWPSRGRCS